MEEQALIIDLVYDIICPWCYVGHERLIKAIKMTCTVVKINLIPFQIRPQIPQEGMPIKEYWAGKGITEIGTAYKTVIEAAEAENIVINPSVFSTIPNTLNIHKVLLMAQKKGVGLLALKDIQAAYFAKGTDLTQLQSIVALTKKYLSEKEVENAWNDVSTLKNEVLAKEQKIKDLHVKAVPTYIVGNKHRISGAISNYTLIDMLLQLAPKETTQNFCAIDGENCSL